MFRVEFLQYSEHLGEEFVHIYYPKYKSVSGEVVCNTPLFWNGALNIAKLKWPR